MGKGGATSDNIEKKEVLIEGRLYDVSGFRHPGGSIITYYSGKPIDATDAFVNFHFRSKKAKKILEHLPSRQYEISPKDEKEVYLPGQKELLEDFHAFQAQLEKEGFFKPAPMHVAYRVFEIIALHAIGFWLLFHQQVILGTIVLGIVCGRCGWLMHEGGHYSLTGKSLGLIIVTIVLMVGYKYTYLLDTLVGKIAIDRLLQVIIYGVGCGMSGSWWRNQHNKHHSMPQKIGHDVDLNTLPLVCFTEKIVKKIGFPLKLWIRLQTVLFPVITTLLVALGWQFYLHPRHIVRTKHYSEAAALITRYAAFTYFVIPHFGFKYAALWYLAYTWIGANYIFINFAVSHTHLPVVPKDDTKVDWIRYAAIYTMNVHPGPFKFINWWMSYLNFQIEHHLFPSMPQFRHPIISPRVKQLFEKHGLKYDQRSYVESLRVTFANLHQVGHDVFLG